MVCRETRLFQQLQSYVIVTSHSFHGERRQNRKLDFLTFDTF